MILAAFLFIAQSYSVPTDLIRQPDPQAYADFIAQLDKFNRKLGGCPLTGPPVDCHPGAGVDDVKLWEDIMRRAKKIFALEPVVDNVGNHHAAKDGHKKSEHGQSPTN